MFGTVQNTPLVLVDAEINLHRITDWYFLDQTFEIWSFMKKFMRFLDSHSTYFSNVLYTDKHIFFLPNFVMAQLK